MVCFNHEESFTFVTPIGDMLLTLCSKGLHQLSQHESISDINFRPNKNQRVILLNHGSLNGQVQLHVADCASWLINYFETPQLINQQLVPTICPDVMSENGSFYERVWITLAKEVPLGQTISYGELAKMAKSPGASQSVGNAMAANSLQIIVPCHRVVRAGALLGQYARGTKNRVKIWLLEHEGLKIVKNKIVQM